MRVRRAAVSALAHTDVNAGGRDSWKTACAVAAAAYFAWAVFHPTEWRMIDNVNLVIHEAGHVIFNPLGEFLTIAGGSLFQVIVPAVFAGYFFRRGQTFSGALVLFWLGESVLNVSVYAGDAVLMQLPLLGGDNSLHDWNLLLTKLDLLDRTAFIGRAIHFASALITLAAIGLSLAHARRTTSRPDDDYCGDF